MPVNTKGVPAYSYTQAEIDREAQRAVDHFVSLFKSAAVRSLPNMPSFPESGNAGGSKVRSEHSWART